MFHRFLILLILSIVSARVSHSQPSRIDAPPQLTTVCEALDHRHHWNNKVVAIVGVRGWTFEGQWLSDEGCNGRIITKGFSWPNDISLEMNSAIAPDPAALSRIDETALTRMIRLVKVRNKLRPPRGNEDGDRVVVVYGLFQSWPQLKPPKSKTDWGNGYGHMNGSPAQLVIKDGSIRYF